MDSNVATCMLCGEPLPEGEQVFMYHGYSGPCPRELRAGNSTAERQAAKNLKYRKKPVVVEAFQMTEARRADNAEWPGWLHSAWQLKRGSVGSLYPTVEGTGDGTLSIETLEGAHLVSWGDWIIRGIKGELYPCKPDIFSATYDAVEEQDGALKGEGNA